MPPLSSEVTATSTTAPETWEAPSTVTGAVSTAVVTTTPGVLQNSGMLAPRDDTGHKAL